MEGHDEIVELGPEYNDHRLRGGVDVFTQMSNDDWSLISPIDTVVGRPLGGEREHGKWKFGCKRKDLPERWPKYYETFAREAYAFVRHSAEGAPLVYVRNDGSDEPSTTPSWSNAVDVRIQLTESEALARLEKEEPAVGYPNWSVPPKELKNGGSGELIAYARTDGLNKGETFHTDGTSFKWNDDNSTDWVYVTEDEAKARVKKVDPAPVEAPLELDDSMKAVVRHLVLRQVQQIADEASRLVGHVTENILNHSAILQGAILGDTVSAVMKDRKKPAEPDDFRQRLVVEKEELDKKIAKLDIVIKSPMYKELSVEHRNYLMDQSRTMSRYSYILYCRIKLAEEEAGDKRSPRSK